MSRRAYRLQTIKSEDNYIEAGFTPKQAAEIINAAWEEDEDFITKKDFVKTAKKLANEYSKRLGYKIGPEVLFGDPEDTADDYRYCSKCETFFYASDGCECDNEW